MQNCFFCIAKNKIVWVREVSEAEWISGNKAFLITPHAASQIKSFTSLSICCVSSWNVQGVRLLWSVSWMHTYRMLQGSRRAQQTASELLPLKTQRRFSSTVMYIYNITAQWTSSHVVRLCSLWYALFVDLCFLFYGDRILHLLLIILFFQWMLTGHCNSTMESLSSHFQENKRIGRNFSLDRTRSFIQTRR